MIEGSIGGSVDRSVNVGIVGYGYAGRNFHSYLVPLARGLRLAAIASSSPEKRRRIELERGCRAVAGIEDLLADPGIDLVVLATPHDTHAALAIAALEAGKHVVTDKVMCLSLREADGMIEAASRHGRMLSVFQNRRWDWDYQTVRRIIDAGLIGRPYLYECAVLGAGSPRGWRADPERSGGVLHDWGAHLLDQALQIVPSRVAAVSCQMLHGRADRPAATLGRLVLSFADGTVFEISCGHMVGIGKPRWYVLGGEGAIVREALDPQEQAMNRGDIDAAREDASARTRVRMTLGGLPAEVLVDSVRSSWKDYYQNISDHLLGGAPLAVTAESVRRSVAVYEAAARAVTAGGSVAVDI